MRSDRVGFFWKSIACIGWLLTAGCVYVNQSGRGQDSFALQAEAESQLGRLLAGTEGAGVGRALVINDATLALTSRLDLIDAAESSIDVQYFIWQNDPSGILVIDRLLAAADRGVRIRALVDDVQLEGLVAKIIAIDEHPNIEVRIFNPFSVRFGFRLRLFRLAEFAIDGIRLNHRMHNKLLVADNQLAILGGRNIGDDYFGLSRSRNFVDTDLLLSGAIVPDLSVGFDSYWNSDWSVSAQELLNIDLRKDALESLRSRIELRLAEYPGILRLVAPERVASLVADLRDAHVLDDALAVVDLPDLRWGERPDEIADVLTELALSAEQQILIVSPYLVLTPKLLDLGGVLESRGVKRAVITNSLASNDVVIAHAAYARFRRDVLETGAELYEFRGDPALMQDDPAESYSLHSKYILFDNETVFLGSLNLDPRSLHLNTELGVVLRSASLTEELENYFAQLIDGSNAWHVTLAESDLMWRNSEEATSQQPAKNGWQRFRSWLMSFLPLTNQV